MVLPPEEKRRGGGGVGNPLVWAGGSELGKGASAQVLTADLDDLFAGNAVKFRFVSATATTRTKRRAEQKKIRTKKNKRTKTRIKQTAVRRENKKPNKQ